LEGEGNFKSLQVMGEIWGLMNYGSCEAHAEAVAPTGTCLCQTRGSHGLAWCLILHSDDPWGSGEV